jgi:hypothetical protein
MSVRSNPLQAAETWGKPVIGRHHHEPAFSWGGVHNWSDRAPGCLFTAGTKQNKLRQINWNDNTSGEDRSEPGHKDQKPWKLWCPGRCDGLVTSFGKPCAKGCFTACKKNKKKMCCMVNADKKACDEVKGAFCGDQKTVNFAISEVITGSTLLSRPNWPTFRRCTTKGCAPCDEDDDGCFRWRVRRFVGKQSVNMSPNDKRFKDILYRLGYEKWLKKWVCGLV